MRETIDQESIANCENEFIERTDANIEVKPLYNLFKINHSKHFVWAECIVSFWAAEHVSFLSATNALFGLSWINKRTFGVHRILFDSKHVRANSPKDNTPIFGAKPL